MRPPGRGINAIESALGNVTKAPEVLEMSQHPNSEPFELFQRWYAEAKASEPNDPNAIALATVAADGQPSVRMVLLKDADLRGFVFYTNYESRTCSRSRTASTSIVSGGGWRSSIPRSTPCPKQSP